MARLGLAGSSLASDSAEGLSRARASGLQSRLKLSITPEVLELPLFKPTETLQKLDMGRVSFIYILVIFRAYKTR